MLCNYRWTRPQTSTWSGNESAHACNDHHSENPGQNPEQIEFVNEQIESACILGAVLIIVKALSGWSPKGRRSKGIVSTLKRYQESVVLAVMVFKWPTNGISGHRWQTARTRPNQSVGAFHPLVILRWDSSVDTAVTIEAHIVVSH